MSVHKESRTDKTEKAGALPASIFRAYDIRGIAGSELSSDNVRLIAKAIASEALSLGIDTLFVGFDGRVSSPELSPVLIEGIISTGCNVINLGLIPSPVLYYATHTHACGSGVMLTASHNPADYNGLKMVFKRECLAENQIQKIRTRAESEIFANGKGKCEHLDIKATYIDDIGSKINLAKPMRIVVDCGNAVPGVVAPDLFEKLGCEVFPLFCEVDGRFPNHHPDPTVSKNLTHLCQKVVETNADLGIAFDGDGDRVAVVTNRGEIISTDKLLMLLIKSIAPLYPKQAIIFDVKCSRAIAELATELGAVPIMHRSGHSLMKQKMIETGAPLGGEFAAHIFIKDRWYGFDDGLYVAARAVEILSELSHSASEEFKSIVTPLSTPEIKVEVDESAKFDLIESMKLIADFPSATIIDLDGLRIEFDYGWGLIRASNTSSALLLRFEAQTTAQIDDLKSQFKALIHCADKTLQLDF